MNSWKSNKILNGKYSSYLNGKYHDFQGLYNSLEEIKKLVEETLEYAESVEEKNKELLDEHWKDKQLAEMKEKYSQMEKSFYRGFPISEDQQKAINNWEDQHWTNRHGAPDNRSRLMKSGAIGGSFEYRFTPTSIGTVGSVCCQSCKQKVKRELGDLSGKERIEKEKELNEKYDVEFLFQDLD